MSDAYNPLKGIFKGVGVLSGWSIKYVSSENKRVVRSSSAGKSDKTREIPISSSAPTKVPLSAESFEELDTSGRGLVLSTGDIVVRTRSSSRSSVGSTPTDNINFALNFLHDKYCTKDKPCSDCIAERSARDSHADINVMSGESSDAEIFQLSVDESSSVIIDETHHFTNALKNAPPLSNKQYMISFYKSRIKALGGNI